MAKVIGVLSLKGGVGKTFSVVSLGSALSSFGKKVLLVDGNLSAPDLGLYFNLLEPEATIHDVLEGKAHAKDAVHKFDEFDIIPASMFYRGEVNPLKLKDKIKGLKKRYDHILIDSSPALNDETLATILASDSLIVVSTPDHLTLGNTMSAVKLAKHRGTPIIGMVLNKVYNKNFELSLDDIEDTADVPVLAVIPHDVKVMKSLSEFAPYTSFKPKAEGAEEYKRLAATLIGEKYKPTKMKRFFRWVNPKKQDINRLVFYDRVFK